MTRGRATLAPTIKYRYINEIVSPPSDEGGGKTEGFDGGRDDALCAMMPVSAKQMIYLRYDE